MICTYIFEDTTGQLGRWARYKKQDIVLHFSTIPRGGRNWAVSSYDDTGETKPESCIQCEYFDLVAAVVTHNRGRGIEAIYGSLKYLENEDDERTSLFLNKQSNSLLIPRETLDDITIDYGDVDFYTKPEYVTPLKVNQNGYFDISSGEETAYYMVSALPVVSGLEYSNLLTQANNILNINDVAHKRNQPFSKHNWRSYAYNNIKLHLNGSNQGRSIYKDLLANKTPNNVSAMHELICIGDMYHSRSLEYIGDMEEITQDNEALPWVYVTVDKGNMRWEIYKVNSPDYDQLKPYILVNHETFGVYTDSVLGKRCTQTINAWEKSSGLTFGDL